MDDTDQNLTTTARHQDGCQLTGGALRTYLSHHKVSMNALLWIPLLTMSTDPSNQSALTPSDIISHGVEGIRTLLKAR